MNRNIYNLKMIVKLKLLLYIIAKKQETNKLPVSLHRFYTEYLRHLLQ